MLVHDFLTCGIINLNCLITPQIVSTIIRFLCIYPRQENACTSTFLFPLSFFFSFSVLGIPIKLYYLTFNIIEEMIHGLTLLPIFFVLPHLIGLNLIHIHMVRRHNICHLSVTLIFIFVLIFILHINIFNYHCLSFSCNFPSHFLVA